MTLVARLLLVLPCLLVLIAAPAAQAQPFNFHQQLTGAVAGATFGKSVDVDGNIAVGGAPGEENRRGAAYVYVKANGVWTLLQRLLPATRYTTADFGRSAAVSGTTIVVGAPGDDSGEGSGAAYVFVWNGAAWVQQARLLPSNGEYHESYGWSVAVDGDTAIVGAQFADRYALVSGAAYAYERSGSTWVERILVPTDPGEGDRFGWSVSVSGNTACVSSMEDRNSGYSASGSVYLFTRGAAGWSVQQKLFAPVPGYPSAFGSSCAIDGNTLAVGSIYANGVGLGHVFVRSGSTWALQQTLQVSAPAAQRIGDSVDVRGDVLVLGAPESNPATLTRAGAAYVFTRAGATWTRPGHPEALTLLRNAIDASDRHAVNPGDVAVLVQNLGLQLTIAGQLDEAETRLRDALRRMDALAAPPPERNAVLRSLSELMRTIENYPEAERFGAAAVEGGARAFPAEHVFQPAFKTTWGRALVGTGQLKRARTVLLDALAGFRRFRPETHPDLAGVRLGLGAVYRMQGHLRDSERILRDARGVMVATPGNKSMSAGTAGEPGLTVRALGGQAEAQALLAESHAGFKAVLGDAHPYTRRALARLQGATN